MSRWGLGLGDLEAAERDLPEGLDAVREFDELVDLLLAQPRCDYGAPLLQRRSGIRCEADHLFSLLGLNGGAPAIRGEEEVVARS